MSPSLKAMRPTRVADLEEEGGVEGDDVEAAVTVHSTDPKSASFERLRNSFRTWLCLGFPALVVQLLSLLFLLTCHSAACPDGKPQSEVYKCPIPLEVPAEISHYCKDGSQAIKFYQCDPLEIVDKVDQACMQIQFSIHVAFAVIWYALPACVFAIHYLRLIL